MGASGSINKSIIQTDVITEAYSKCPNVVASNELDIKNVTFKCNSHCGPNCKIVFSQDAGIDATCLITNLQDVMAETISKMNADAQTGLGLAVTKNKNEIKTQLKNKIDASCGNLSSVNKANISDTIMEACEWRIPQNATIKTSCEINTLQKIATKNKTEQKGNSTGFFGGNTWAIVICIILVVIIVAAVIAVIVKYRSDKKGLKGLKEQKGGLLYYLNHNFADTLNKNKSCFTIIIILLILLILFLFYSNQRKIKITQEDLDVLQNKVTNDREIYDEHNLSDEKRCEYITIPNNECNLFSESENIVNNKYISVEDKQENPLDKFYKTLI
uniref:Myristylated IMV envelope protein n=1 Tax=viral metagenome TaxID=1070528 RepID=A0A6C0LR29_9ZZZZ